MVPHGRKSPGRKAEAAYRWSPQETTGRVGVAAWQVLRRQSNDPHIEGTRSAREIGQNILMTTSTTRKYRAFISYSHAADDRLAPALQSGLHRFAKPWYRLRAMRVFRDKTGLAVTPELWGSIQKALEDADYFIPLASPRAAQSKWVEQEVDWWLRNRSATQLLIVWTDGELRWDPAAGDFDWINTTALPKRLEKV